MTVSMLRGEAGHPAERDRKAGRLADRRRAARCGPPFELDDDRHGPHDQRELRPAGDLPAFRRRLVPGKTRTATLRAGAGFAARAGGGGRRLRRHEPLLCRLHGRLPERRSRQSARDPAWPEARGPWETHREAAARAARDWLSGPHLRRQGAASLGRSVRNPGQTRRRTAFVVRAAGYLGAADRPYFESLQKRIAAGPLAGRFEYVGELDRPQKIAFLQSLDMFSVPTVYRESKGLPVLEAMANAVPVVLPDHGSFSELVADTERRPALPAARSAGPRRQTGRDCCATRSAQRNWA